MTPNVFDCSSNDFLPASASNLQPHVLSKQAEDFENHFARWAPGLKLKKIALEAFDESMTATEVFSALRLATFLAEHCTSRH